METVQNVRKRKDTARTRRGRGEERRGIELNGIVGIEEKKSCW
jgi:hypothetical protein